MTSPPVSSVVRQRINCSHTPIPSPVSFHLSQFVSERVMRRRWQSGRGVGKLGRVIYFASKSSRGERSLERRTRSWAMVSASDGNHAAPEILSRAWSTCLWPASMSPLPMGGPTAPPPSTKQQGTVALQICRPARPPFFQILDRDPCFWTTNRTGAGRKHCLLYPRRSDGPEKFEKLRSVLL